MPERKAKLPPSAVPHQCVLLALDTAENSGWALYVRGKLHGFGEVDMLRAEDRGEWNADRVCMHAIWEAGYLEKLPCVMVYERPFRGTVQGQWIGAWKRAWVLNNGRKAAMVGVYPSSWRARVFGRGNMDRDTARELETRRASGIVCDDMTDTSNDVRPDESAAICIGQWAIHAGEVGAKVPKRAWSGGKP
jgi:hypothetical protein